MGQYQQWLHYRDIDRLLHAQLEELEEELTQLQVREQLLLQILQPVTGDAPSLLQSGNEILRALAIGSNGHTEPRERSQGHTQSANGATEMTAISPAPAAQNGLPPAEEPYITDPNSLQLPQPPLHKNMTPPPVPHSPHYEPAMLLPEDMDAFIDGHTETEPRMELPAWLRNAALHNANGPIDQESMRTNRLIQRWIERWGRHQELQPGAQEPRREDTSL
jgi:hypothetical protein